MRRFSTFASAMVLLCVVITVRALGQAPPVSSAGGTPDVAAVTADVVTTGIPGAGAITHIGTFHKGGPFVERPLFALETQPGRVLDPERLFVASTSNFGAPLARPDEAEGSILSIDVTGAPMPFRPGLRPPAARQAHSAAPSFSIRLKAPRSSTARTTIPARSPHRCRRSAFRWASR